MQTKRFLPFAFAIMAAAIATLGFAGEPKNHDKLLSLEGSYKLIMRRLPDGSMHTAPEVNGMLTFTKTHRNLNIVWKDAQGKLHSHSVVSTYKLTATEYSETMLFGIENDAAGAQKTNYDLSGQSRSVPLVANGNRLEFQLPFDHATIAFDENWITTKVEGKFTDYWERVE